MARLRTTVTGPGRGAHVIAAYHLLTWARFYQQKPRGDSVELAGDDPTMAKLTPAERDWVRDLEAGRLDEKGSLLEIIDRRFGPFDPDAAETRGRIERLWVLPTSATRPDAPPPSQAPPRLRPVPTTIE